MILFCLLLSIFGKSVFSSIIEDTVPQIEEINKVILDNKPIDPSLSSLSAFLNKKKNWKKFSEALNKDENKLWLSGLAKDFNDSVVRKMLFFKPGGFTYANTVAIYQGALNKLTKFTLDPDFDAFLPLWIKTLSLLKLLHEKKINKNISDIVDFESLPSVAKALTDLFIVFKVHLEKSSPLSYTKGFLDELKTAVGIKGSKPDDTPGGPTSVPPDVWSTQKKILVFGSIGVVIVFAILFALLVLRKPRPGPAVVSAG